MEPRKDREKRQYVAISGLAIVLLILVVAIGAASLIYLWYTGFSTSALGKINRMQTGFVRVEAVQAGVGYVKLYVRSINFVGKVDTVYFLDPNDYSVLAYAILPEPVNFTKGEVKEIVVPLILVKAVSAKAPLVLGLEANQPAAYFAIADVLSKPVLIGLGTYGVGGISVTAISEEPINMKQYIASAQSKAVIGLLAGRTRAGRAMDKNYIHYIRLNLVTGEYEMIYIAGTTVKTASGRAKVFTETNRLDLSRLSWKKRYDLGPVIVFLNPYFAVKPYSVTVVNIHGRPFTATLKSLVPDKTLVGLDAVVFWEDLWWPGTGASLDNYIDHVVRITAFTNDTVRIEVIHASGCYLHMLFINPPPADKNTIQRIVEQYMSKPRYRLPPESGAVYVKTHGAYVPPLGPHDIWDPIKGDWATTWPPVFYR